MVDNAEQGLAKACEATGAQIIDYSAAPVFHGCTCQVPSSVADRICRLCRIFREFLVGFLTLSLQQINSDYEAKRHKNITLQPLEIIVARPNLFHDWLKEKGKLGGQHKVPRLSNTRDI